MIHWAKLTVAQRAAGAVLLYDEAEWNAELEDEQVAATGEPMAMTPPMKSIGGTAMLPPSEGQPAAPPV